MGRTVEEIMVNNNTRFNLVSKLDGNIGAIYLALPNGNITDIMWIRFPNDKQVSDNVETMNNIIPILRKRIRRSLC